MFSSAISAWLLWLAFRMILSILNEPNLNFGNFFEVLSNPLAIILFAAYLLIVAFFLFLEFSMLTFLAYSERYKKSIAFRCVICNAFKKLKNVLSPQILLFAAYFIALIPLSNFGASPFLFEKFKIPQFIFLEVSKNPALATTAFVLILAIIYLNYRLIFTLPILMLKSKNLLASLKKSWQLSKTRHANIVGSIFIFELLLGFAIFGIFVLLHFVGEKFGVSIFVNALTSGMTFVGVAVSKIFVVNLLIEVLAQEGVIHDNLLESDSFKKRKNIAWLVLVGVFCLLFVVSNLLSFFDFNFNSRAKIIAHRGFSKTAIENSLESLRLAKKAGADFVEADVQMTKDGEFVIFHDLSLKRLAGIDAQIKDLNLAKVKKIKLKQGEFEAKIPTLEEFAQEAKNLKISVFWELKLSKGFDEDFVEKFVSKIDKLNLQNDRFMSINRQIAIELESRRPDLKVGLIVPFQFGDFDERETFDFYAIEVSSYDADAVVRAMLGRKEVYIWTVNDLDEISKYFSKQNNGIITDEVEQASNLRKRLKSGKNS